MPCLILSIDGGGLRGIIPVLILKHIEQKVQASNGDNNKLVSYFHLVSGTSTGGLIACGLALGDQQDTSSTKYDLTFIENIYKTKGQIIFPYKGWLGEWWRSLPCSHLMSPQFKKHGLETVLKEIFDDQKITNCIRPILIPSYNVLTNEPVYFSSRKAFENADLNFKLSDVCRATSAGPTYLPAHEITIKANNKMICVDGGVFQNNPTVSALVEIMKYPDIYMPGEKVSLDDVYILSIGTGRYEKPVAIRTAFFGGKLGWVNSIVDISMWGNSQAVDIHVSEVLKFSGKKNQYLRINAKIIDKKFSDMANCSDEAMNHYISRFKEDFVDNPVIQSALDQWLLDSGIVKLQSVANAPVEAEVTPP